MTEKDGKTFVNVHRTFKLGLKGELQFLILDVELQNQIIQFQFLNHF